MKRTVFSLLAAFALCVSAAAVGPAVSCPSALLMEKQTGTVLFAQDEHTPREPASVTKIMTLLLVMEAIDSGALLRRRGDGLGARGWHGRQPDLAQGE